MRKVITIVIGFIIQLSCDLGAQVPLTTTVVDGKTYELWTQGNWDELIQVADQALENGIDFYYLRYRLGIAWFQKKNFHKAATHFKVARNMNRNDNLLNEYLYYSLLYGGWTYEAEYLRLELPQNVQESLGILMSNPLKQVYLAYSTESGGGPSEMHNIEQTETLGYQLLSKGHYLLNFGLEHRVYKNFWLHHAYNFIHKDTYRFISSEISEPSETELVLNLNQYYLGSTLLLGSGWELGFGGHYINLKYDDFVLTTLQGRAVNRLVRQSQDHYVGFVRTKFKSTGWSLGATSIVGNLGSRTHFQQDVILELYPFGNKNLYSVSVFSLQDQDVNSQNENATIIVDQTVGLKVARKIWLEGFSTFGTLENFIQANGSILFNDTNVITQRFGMKLYYQLSTPLLVRVDFTRARKESKFVPSTSSVVIEPIEYNVSSLTAVLIWNF